MTTTLSGESPKFEMIPHWVMDHPDITGNAIRLYLLLRRYADKSGVSFPSRRTLCQDLGIAANTLDVAVGKLRECGALRVVERFDGSGRQTSNHYILAFEPPMEQGEGGKNCVGGGGQKLSSQELIPIKNLDSTPTVLAEPEVQPSSKAAQALAEMYAKRVPLSKFVAIRGIVKKALAAGYSSEQIAVALNGLADEGRPVTVDTLRIQMEGMPSSSNLDRKRKRQQEVLARYSRTEIEG